MRFVPIFLVALVASIPAQAAPPPSKQVTALKRENATLRAQVKRLKRDLGRAKAISAQALADVQNEKRLADEAKTQVGALQTQVTTLTTERDQARTALGTAQTGVSGALSTLPVAAVWALFRSPIAAKFNSGVLGVWQQSYYSSDNYESWTFTRCGFCG